MNTVSLSAPHRTGFLQNLRRFIPFLGPRRVGNGDAAGLNTESVNPVASRLSWRFEWIARAAEVCESAARGDLEVRILRCHEGGDVERLVHAINDLLDRTEAFVREAGAPLEAANQARFYRRVVLRGMLGSFRRTSELINRACQDMSQNHAALHEAAENRRALADQFEASVQKVVSALVASAGQVNDAAQALSAAAGSAGAAPQVASQSPSPQSAPTPRAAVGTQPSAPPSHPPSRVSASAPTTAGRELNTVVAELVEASQRIGGVVKLISQIAAQTNLLALNATIEAARAGEVGRGFGVVANEVKGLSQQTAKATDQIRREITAVRDTAQSTADLVGSMSRRISDMSEISSHVSNQATELSESVDNFLRTIRA